MIIDLLLALHTTFGLAVTGEKGSVAGIWFYPLLFFLSYNLNYGTYAAILEVFLGFTTKLAFLSAVSFACLTDTLIWSIGSLIYFTSVSIIILDSFSPVLHLSKFLCALIVSCTMLSFKPPSVFVYSSAFLVYASIMNLFLNGFSSF